MKSDGEQRAGLLYGIGAYGMWGLVPLFWPLLKPSGATEILAHRMVWSLAVVGIALLALKRWSWVRELIRQPRKLGLITVAAAVITVNWGLYIDAASPEVFELVDLAVNGTPQKIRRSVRNEGQVFTCNLGSDVETDEAVTVSYTYRVLVQQHGRVLHLDLAQPTKNFRAELCYGDCGIRHMNVVDYLSGPRQPRHTHLSASDPSPSVEVAYDGWTFPKAAWRSCGCWSGRCRREPRVALTENPRDTSTPK